jgi:hypothetical protein
MEINFSDIEDAFYFVSSDPDYENEAIVDKKSGKIFYSSEMTGIDDIPHNIDLDSDQYAYIPHKNNLNLGRDLAIDFAHQFLENELNEVYAIFNRKGAYKRFKDLLNSKALLEKWYSYEEENIRSALHEWCNENKIKLSA